MSEHDTRFWRGAINGLLLASVFWVALWMTLVVLSDG